MTVEVRRACNFGRSRVVRASLALTLALEGGTFRAARFASITCRGSTRSKEEHVDLKSANQPSLPRRNASRSDLASPSPSVSRTLGMLVLVGLDTLALLLGDSLGCAAGPERGTTLAATGAASLSLLSRVSLRALTAGIPKH